MSSSFWVRELEGIQASPSNTDVNESSIGLMFEVKAVMAYLVVSGYALHHKTLSCQFHSNLTRFGTNKTNISHNDSLNFPTSDWSQYIPLQ